MESKQLNINITITNEKIGRNQKVTISNGSETKELKWKNKSDIKTLVKDMVDSEIRKISND